MEEEYFAGAGKKGMLRKMRDSVGSAVGGLKDKVKDSKDILMVNFSEEMLSLIYVTELKSFSFN